MQGEYELNTGKVIIETLATPAAAYAGNCGVSARTVRLGKDAHDAVHNAVVMEEVAKMAWIARSINPQLNHIDSFLMNKHFMRKHGPNAYYGRSKQCARNYYLLRDVIGLIPGPLQLKNRINNRCFYGYQWIVCQTDVTSPLWRCVTCGCTFRNYFSIC